MISTRSSFTQLKPSGLGLKGLRVGGAQVSPKHSGFVVNDQNGTCQDVLDVVEKVKEAVRRETGVQLECEVRLIGR